MNTNFSLYAFRDKKVGFLSPFIDLDDELAIRQFVHLVMCSRSPDESISSSVKGIPINDLELFRLGSYDISSGLISPLAVPALLVSADSIDSTDDVSSYYEEVEPDAQP